jgi:hypothetical protein
VVVAADVDMKVDARTEDAIRRISGSPEGRAFIEYLRKWYDVDKEALVMSEQPEQTRRLQGTSRRMKELLSLFETN